MKLDRGLILLAVLALQIIVGCNYTKFKNSDSDFHNTGVLTKAERDAIGFQTVFRDIIDPYCLSCHRSGRFPLNNYAETYSIVGEIRNTVFVLGSMPKGKFLPARERSILLAWLDAGAPEAGKSPPQPEPEIPPLQPTFSSIRDRIFKVRCGDCHEPTSRECQDLVNLTDEDHHDDEHEHSHNKGACKLELSIFNELLNGDEETRKELVIPGNPDESQLIISIERTDGKDQMPPPEQGYSPLSPEEIKAIRDWISGGALNN